MDVRKKDVNLDHSVRSYISIISHLTLRISPSDLALGSRISISELDLGSCISPSYLDLVSRRDTRSEGEIRDPRVRCKMIPIKLYTKVWSNTLC